MQHQSTSISFWSMMLAVGIASVWGFNFVAIKFGLNEIPPLTLCALRFFFVSIPAIFFIQKPKVPWKDIICYGLLTFVVSFSLLFLGMSAGVSPGIAALILQFQVFFAVFFALIFAHQKVNAWQIVGALTSFVGIAAIGLNRDGSCTLVGFLFILGAGFAWGLGNVISAKMKAVNSLSLVIWGSFFAFFPLMGAALYLEKPIELLSHIGQLSWASIFSLAYITYASTHFGYGSWAWLLSKYPIANITPFAFLSPVVALLCSTIILHESFAFWKLIATTFVILGLCLNVFGQKMLAWCLQLLKRANSKMQPTT